MTSTCTNTGMIQAMMKIAASAGESAHLLEAPGLNNGWIFQVRHDGPDGHQSQKKQQTDRVEKKMSCPAISLNDSVCDCPAKHERRSDAAFKQKSHSGDA